MPDRPVEGFEDHLTAFLRGKDLVIVMNLWDWDEAIAVLVPARGILRITGGLRQFYPDGLLVADQHMQSGLLVDFDDVDGTQVALIGVEEVDKA